MSEAVGCLPILRLETRLAVGPARLALFSTPSAYFSNRIVHLDLLDGFQRVFAGPIQRVGGVTKRQRVSCRHPFQAGDIRRLTTSYQDRD